MMSVSAEKRVRIKSRKAAAAMSAQRAYDKARKDNVPPAEAAEKLAVAAAAAAEAAGMSAWIGANPARQLYDKKAAEVCLVAY